MRMEIIKADTLAEARALAPWAVAFEDEGWNEWMAYEGVEDWTLARDISYEESVSTDDVRVMVSHCVWGAIELCHMYSFKLADHFSPTEKAAEEIVDCYLDENQNVTSEVYALVKKWLDQVGDSHDYRDDDEGDGDES